jgi:hypothetical protein
MIITQALISIFVFFALSRVILRFREEKVSTFGLFGWVTLWLIVEVVIWVPDFATSIARILGIGRGADLIIYFSIVALFYLVFRIYVKFEDLERQITFIVRSIALQKISRTKKKVKK